jgi:4-alpha-glucanotransferase
MFERSSGILMPISSIPSRYGIGTLGREAYNFIDFLNLSKQKYWQLLPLGPISYGDSPYSSFSSYAGNPYYIDLELLVEDGILSNEDCIALETQDEYIDYEKQFNLRYDILYRAFINSKSKYSRKISEFKNKNHWIYDYSLFMALKYYFKQKPWYEWEYEIANRNDNALEQYNLLLKEEAEFWTFLQFMFFEQYFNLKAYANKKGINIIGDLPIYVAEDSADVWSNRKFFNIDDNMFPGLLAGVPPDAFSNVGQLWGNPVYDWEMLKENSYEWWIKRLSWSFILYDVLRIDHFRGFDEFWAVTKNSVNAVNGRWYSAQGKELFEQAKRKLGNINVIAEDLGIITDSVVKLKNDFGFPGMKVIQFAFDNNPLNPYLPSNYEENCVAYTGTHDNDTLKGWLEKLDDSSKDYVEKCLGISSNDFTDTNKIIYKIIDILFTSKANLCIVPLQDFLCLGSEARINTPSTLGNNWTWRVRRELLTDELAENIKKMVVKTGR